MIAAIGYDEEAKELHVEFNGGRIYRYGDVPKDAFEAFRTAESIGKHFGQSIRNTYKAL